MKQICLMFLIMYFFFPTGVKAYCTCQDPIPRGSLSQKESGASDFVDLSLYKRTCRPRNTWCEFSEIHICLRLLAKHWSAKAQFALTKWIFQANVPTRLGSWPGPLWDDGWPWRSRADRHARQTASDGDLTPPPPPILAAVWLAKQGNATGRICNLIFPAKESVQT